MKKSSPLPMNRSATVLKASRSESRPAAAGLRPSRAPGLGFKARTSVGQILTLRGHKVFLRPPATADFREFSALMKVRRAEFRGFVTGHVNRKWFNDFVQRWQGEDARSFLICRQPDGVIVGSIGIFNIVRRHAKTAFTGYSVGARHTRQGYATEALQLVLRFAFKNLKLHRVEASIQPHNFPSLALVKRAGFRCEGLSRKLVKIGGRWRDHERWAILAEDWRPLRRNENAKPR